MKKILSFVGLSMAVLFTITPSNAQQKDRFAYAVTDVTEQGANWSFLRKLNLQTGEYSPILLKGDDVSFLANDATSKKQFAAPLMDARYGQTTNAAFATGVAAMAFDKKNNRLYYTPMFIDQLRYIDLKTMKVYFVTDQAFTGMPEKTPDQGNIVTRMVIAEDGNGYAMTNDGTQLIKFTTGKKIKITNMGSVVDDPANKTISVHNSCSSYGGDMIADDNGNLFVLTARNHVFKVNIESKVATHVGLITGLPNGFTVNGAAVNENNQIIVGSAMEASSYFAIDYTSLTASPYKIAGQVLHSSDLANSNLLATTERTPTPTVTEVTSRPIVATSRNISIYPNPISDNQFVVQFGKMEAGKYLVQVTDVVGREVMQRNITISGENQTERINLNPSVTKGVYLVKVVNAENNLVESIKIVLQ